MHDTLTTATAGAAVASPLWLPSLQTISEVASILLPILGALWLIVQIVIKIVEFTRGKRGE